MPICVALWLGHVLSGVHHDSDVFHLGRPNRVTSTPGRKQGTGLSVKLCNNISCYVADCIHNTCVMSVLLLIVGWIVGQGRDGVSTDIATWRGAPPDRNF